MQGLNAFCLGFQPLWLRVNQGGRSFTVCLKWCIAADFSWAACHQEFSLPVKPSVQSNRSSKTVRSLKVPRPSEPSPSGVRTIKKYPNRRLYDTLFSSYVTLSDVKDLVMSQELFHVLDAKTGEDITRSILMQVILEEEAHGQPLFSTQSLLHMIRFYGNSLQGMMAPFLEKNLNQFSDLQNQYLSHCQKLGGLSSPENWLSFMNHQSNVELANPMSVFFESGTQFLEKMKVQSEINIKDMDMKLFL